MIYILLFPFNFFMNIYLIGMMGSGKTSVGQLLSKYLKSTFYDLDSGIEKRFNLTITEIFNEYGEDRFREAESSLLFETNNLENCVISTGGGIVINDTNRNFLRDHRVTNKSSFDDKKINILGIIKLAFQTPSYNFLALGFFTCGFHVAFISTHMPGVIAYCGLPTSLSGWSLAFIGFFNIIGSLFAGWYISKRSKKLFLSSIYLSRALIVLVFLISPKTEVTFLIFSALLGVTYLSTVPPTAALVSKMFGPSCMGTLFGLALFSHQIGAFFGAYLGGYFFTITGEYTFVWLIDIILAIFAAIIHLPIKEKLVTTSTI